MCECKYPKEHNLWEKDYIWNPATWTCENCKYLGTIIYNFSDFSFDEITEAKKSVPKKGVPTKTVSTKSTSTGFYVSTEFYYW